jgi:hypothetical protein
MLRKLLTLVAAVGLAAALVAGCGSGDDGLSEKDRTLANRADTIVKKAAGNWDALSKEDKDYLINEVGSGNEHSARMYFMAKSGQLRGKPPTSGSGPGK